jgi:hypothetical protein
VRTRTAKDHRSRQTWLRPLSGWLGLALILVHVVSAATRTCGVLPVMPDTAMEICTAMGHGAAGHQQDHPAHDGSTDGDCCLAMGCSGAAITGAGIDTPMPTAAWTSLSFDVRLFPQRRPAPSVGGIARAPPGIA